MHPNRFRICCKDSWKYNIDDKVKVDLFELDEPYSWEIWDEEPEYKARLKNSYYKIKDYFAQSGM